MESPSQSWLQFVAESFGQVTDKTTIPEMPAEVIPVNQSIVDTAIPGDIKAGVAVSPSKPSPQTKILQTQNAIQLV